MDVPNCAPIHELSVHCVCVCVCAFAQADMRFLYLLLLCWCATVPGHAQEGETVPPWVYPWWRMVPGPRTPGGVPRWVYPWWRWVPPPPPPAPPRNDSSPESAPSWVYPYWRWMPNDAEEERDMHATSTPLEDSDATLQQTTERSSAPQQWWMRYVPPSSRRWIPPPGSWMPPPPPWGNMTSTPSGSQPRPVVPVYPWWRWVPRPSYNAEASEERLMQPTSCGAGPCPSSDPERRATPQQTTAPAWVYPWWRWVPPSSRRWIYPWWRWVPRPRRTTTRPSDSQRAPSWVYPWWRWVDYNAEASEERLMQPTSCGAGPCPSSDPGGGGGCPVPAAQRPAPLTASGPRPGCIRGGGGCPVPLPAAQRHVPLPAAQPHAQRPAPLPASQPRAPLAEGSHRLILLRHLWLLRRHRKSRACHGLGIVMTL